MTARPRVWREFYAIIKREMSTFLLDSAVRSFGYAGKDIVLTGNAHAVVISKIVECAMDIGTASSARDPEAIAKKCPKNDGIGPRVVGRCEGCLRGAWDSGVGW